MTELRDELDHPEPDELPLDIDMTLIQIMEAQYRAACCVERIERILEEHTRKLADLDGE